MLRLLKSSILLIPILSFGMEGFNSLKIGVYPRQLSMGGIGTSTAKGPSSSFYNPALLTETSSFGMDISYARWFLDTQHSSLFLSRHKKDKAFGFGLINFHYGDIEYRPEYPTPEPLGEYSADDFTLSLSYAQSVDPHTSLGISAKFYYEKIGLDGGMSYGADFGFIYKVNRNLWLGFSINNFAKIMKLKIEGFYLPTEGRFGIGFNGKHFKAGADLSYLFYSAEIRAGIGLEIPFRNFSLRIGHRVISKDYSHREYNEEEGRYENVSRYHTLGLDGLTLGLGIKKGILSLDYSCLPSPWNLSLTHHIGLRVNIK